ncbi:Hypothetical protein SMAX5B_020544 [Scophthalmus maximus]|uniref:BLUF domain-containing protein n=1 Tax=Scophthalmus maximus TaxID=52904 RepID=A0A2U9CNG9_SCOMX|nr:Hypothetical protein SMAX5B_020544 [Scophthalmus maximus]
MEKSEPLKAEEKKEEETGTSLFHRLMDQRKDLRDEDVTTVLQRLLVIARLPHDHVDRTELGAYYERLHFQLSKQYIWDHMTGLLLIYPNCVLHFIESSRDVLVSVVKDLEDMRQQTDCKLLEAAKVVLMAHDPLGRMFPQWSYKVLGEDDAVGDPTEQDEEDETTEGLVLGVLSELQVLSKQLETSKKALPGLVLDENPELIISHDDLEKLLRRDDLLSPRLYLQMYNSPLNVSMGFGQVIRSSCLTTV